MKNIFAVVILYYPQEDWIRNVTSYIDAAEWLMIIDNSEEKTPVPDFLIQNQRVISVHDGENKGIAQRLNQAASLALQHNCNWMLTMDQDSYFDAGQLSNYMAFIEKFDSKSSVAMFGVEHNQEAVTFSQKGEPVSELITSGSLVSLAVWMQLKGFDENLFIDEVDTEFCFRARSGGFEIIKLPAVYLHHTLGKQEWHKSFKNLKATSRILYGKTRIYYLVRNYFYLKGKYQAQFPGQVKNRGKLLLNYIKNSFLYGPEKLSVLRYAFRGYRDYKAGRMGKLGNQGSS